LICGGKASRLQFVSVFQLGAEEFYKLEITIVTSKTQVSGNQDLNKNRSQIVMSSREEIGRISRFVTSHIQGAFDIPIWKVKRPDAQGHLSQNT